MLQRSVRLDRLQGGFVSGREVGTLVGRGVDMRSVRAIRGAPQRPAGEAPEWRRGAHVYCFGSVAGVGKLGGQLSAVEEGRLSVSAAGNFII